MTITAGARVHPFLWFHDQAEAAVDFYCSIFPNAKRGKELRSEGVGPIPRGGIITLDFELGGLRFTALNGGPQYSFTPAVSFMVTCQTQAEVDHYWARLTEGGKEIACGWLEDKFGLSWQVVPEPIFDLLRHPKAMQAMLAMKKLDLAVLQAAARD